jgi:hypothetical protein
MKRFLYWTEIFIGLKLRKIWPVKYSKRFHDAVAQLLTPIQSTFCLSAINNVTVNTYMQLYKQQYIGVRFLLVVRFKSYWHRYSSWFSIQMTAINRWAHQQISPCVVHILMKFWLNVVYHVSVWLFIVGFCSCCVQYCSVSSIPWLITTNNNNDCNQTMDSKTDITMWNASIDTFLVDCCCWRVDFIVCCWFL